MKKENLITTAKIQQVVRASLMILIVLFMTSCEDEDDSSGDNNLQCPDNITEVVDVTNPITGRTWMDRNLGASRAATSITDELAFGDLYQWGRGADGHQCRNSNTTYTKSSTDQPGHGDFIMRTTDDDDDVDWRSPHNDNLWQGLNGINNPCPTGYRLPTKAELSDFINSVLDNDLGGDFITSPLNLPIAGSRNSLSDLIEEDFVAYWSSTPGVSGRAAYALKFELLDDGTIHISYLRRFKRSAGACVRCIKD